LAKKTFSPTDRKLGHEWLDWDGTIESRKEAARASPFLFTGVLGLVTLGGLGCLVGLAYIGLLIAEKPVPFLAQVLLLMLIAVGIASMLVFLLLVGLVVGMLPSSLSRRITPKLAGAAILLGKISHAIGISRDQLGNSFVHLANELTRSRVMSMDQKKILVLLPRCLQPEIRKQALDLVKAHGCESAIAHTGEAARDHVYRINPTAIVAVACERDLVTGLRNVASRIPVLAIPARRPEGPCKNTVISIEEIREAIEFFNHR
jgi:hypothetical protein